MFRHRLLLFTEVFPPDVGGIQHHLAGQWAALPPPTSFVIAPAGPGAEAWDREQPYRIVRTVMRGWTYPRWRPALTTLRQIVREVQPEVLVCGKALFEGRAALRLQRDISLPFVVMTYAMELKTWLSGWKTRRDLLLVLQHAARIVVINRETRQILLDHGVPDRQIVKIFPGVDAAFFEPPANARAVREDLALDGPFPGGESRRGGKRVIITVCRLVPRKGVDVLLRALPTILLKIPQVVLLVVGDGPERTALQRLAAALGLTSSVRFLGRVSRADLLKTLRLGDVFALTPREIGNDIEGFGMAYIEAAAAGLPAVASRSGGVPEAVLDGVTGLLVPPDDPPETAQALLRLLLNGELRARLAAAARARAQNEFPWPRRAILFQGMVESLLLERQRNVVSP